MDTLTLKGLQFFGRHGTEPWEKETGRRFIVDLVLSLDMSLPAQNDRLRDALDYRTVYARAKDVVENESHSLIEKVGGRLLAEMFAAFPSVQGVRVKVSKPEAPIGGLNQSVDVEFSRTREAWEKSANN